MTLSNRTIALLAQPFEGGQGPSHGAIELIWTSADAYEYLGEGNKLARVLAGLRTLQRGRRAGAEGPALPPDHEKLREVAADLATLVMSRSFIDGDALEEAFAKDGFTIEDGAVAAVRPPDEPADRLAEHVNDLFGEDSRWRIARNHYEQGARAFDRGDWEAANAQFRSSLDATYDGLAHALGCPAKRIGGDARKWLAMNGHLEDDESNLLRTFSTFAGRAGSHAGLSGAADPQLRRHFATALIAFGLAKLS